MCDILAKVTTLSSLLLSLVVAVAVLVEVIVKALVSGVTLRAGMLMFCIPRIYYLYLHCHVYAMLNSHETCLHPF